MTVPRGPSIDIRAKPEVVIRKNLSWGGIGMPFRLWLGRIVPNWRTIIPLREGLAEIKELWIANTLFLHI